MAIIPDFLDAALPRHRNSKVKRFFRKIHAKLPSFTRKSQSAVLESTDLNAHRHRPEFSFEVPETAPETVALTSSSIRAVLLDQTERTRGSSKAEIERFIEDSELKVNSLERQITALESQTADAAALVELRDGERAIVAALRHLIAPIHILPIELLVEIFDLTIWDVENARRPWSPYSSHMTRALRVSHICSHWRQVANGTPSLWTGPITVDVDFRSWAKRSQDTFASPSSAAWRVDGMKAWLARSAPHSIPVSIYYERYMDHDLDPDIPPILEEVLKISPRWCSLRLNDPMPASFFRRLAENGLDTLVEADLTKGLAGCNFDSTTISFFAPRLRTLSISSDWLVPMPWAQLTYLYLTGRRSLDISLGVLAQCTNLVTVSINTSGWRTVPQPRDMILLNHLRTLFLSFTRTPAQGHFMPLLDRISAPSLERLRLYSHPNYTWIKAQFTVFQLRSPNITEIELNHSPLTPADLRAVLFHAPSLTHLSVIFCPQCIDDTLLRALTYADGVESLVPRLRHLTLFVINPLSEDVLTSMILSRWWTEVDLSSRSAPPSVARWTDINLTVNHRFFKFSRDFMDIMDGLKGDGLRIQVDT